MSSTSGRVVIGMDPHKRSATIEVMSADEAIHGGGRFGTDRDGYTAMLVGEWVPGDVALRLALLAGWSGEVLDVDGARSAA